MREKLTLGRKSVVTETPVTMTEWIHNSGPSDRSTIGKNNARILKEQNGIKISKVLRTQWIRYGCSSFYVSFKNDSVQDDAIERSVKCIKCGNATSSSMGKGDQCGTDRTTITTTSYIGKPSKKRQISIDQLSF